MASDIQDPLQQALPKTKTEQTILNLSNFHKLLDKIDDEKSQIKFNADDYKTIENNIYRDVKSTLGLRGVALMNCKAEDRANCCYSFKQGAIELYMDVLGSGYKGSLQERSAAQFDCKQTLNSALEVLAVHDAQSMQTQSFSIKRD